MPGGRRRLHVALAVDDLDESVEDYSRRLGHRPSLLVPGEYALWRTGAVNFSIRKTVNGAGLRHLGWEDPGARSFTHDTDVNGITWECFTPAQQVGEIEAAWPGASRLTSKASLQHRRGPHATSQSPLVTPPPDAGGRGAGASDTATLPFALDLTLSARPTITSVGDRPARGAHPRRTIALIPGAPRRT